MLVGLVVAAAWALAPTGASAATIVVDTTDDASPNVSDGNCSQREAISSVGSLGIDDCDDGSDGAVDTIVFDDLTGPGPHVINAARDFILNQPMSRGEEGLEGNGQGAGGRRGR